ELGTRNIKVALRRLRKFAREGAAEELDLPGTIRSTAKQGWLDVKLVPERRNTVKVLLFFDVGGSMDPHVKVCEELFSAARAEFKHMEYFYFHNCIYESVWTNNRRRNAERIDTWKLLHTYPHDYKVIFVGDASMSPFELTHAGGAVEHWNEEPGLIWLQRMAATYPKAVWINPSAEKYWGYSPSISLISRTFEDRMFPLTLDGLDQAMRELVR
ncbi:MAG: VWA domain-containing protein, partial [Alphaproteobacteria bacterium]|nr:VWA domain-containing protein [Alphaproteobacteria bacterium]